MKRRFTLLAVATFVSTSLMASWNGETEVWTKGEGTEGNPYQIETESHLAYLAEQVNSGERYIGVYFIQKADLDLGGIQNNDGIWSGRQWIPIGNNSDQFYGTYDGGEFVISNIYYNDPATEYVGLFGGINNATLKNITLASGFLYGYQYTGGICGIAKGHSTITCCANIATIYGKMERIGGILAQIDGTSEVNNCINYGIISAFNFSGGVIGGRNKSSVQKVSHCINVGQVFTMRCSGNLYGLNNSGGGETEFCYYDNQINASEGWTTNSKEIQNNIDAVGQMEGKPTSQIIGNGLASVLDEDLWVFDSEMYPRLKNSCNKEAVILAATPVILPDGNKADNVTSDFNVSTKNNIVWESSGVSKSNPSVEINGRNAKIINSTGVILTAKISNNDNYTKSVFIRTNKSGATPMGTIDAPLPIENESDLIALQQAMKYYGTYKGCANYDGFKGLYFEQKVNIELTTSWTEAIGVHNSFKGNYDGGGNNITNVNIDLIDEGIAIVGGLFNCASYGEIKNVSLQTKIKDKDNEEDTEGVISGIQFVGGICGATFCERLTNCISNCKVDIGESNSYAGGIVGVDKGYSIFNNCENYGVISGNTCIGGILGTSNIESSFIGCKNFGKISGKQNIAGICSDARKNNEFQNCENHDTISSSSSVGGGIIGTTSENGITAINCINTGIIDGKSKNGGIVGNATGIIINNCLNLGEIKGTNAGGISGSTASSVSISHCFNAGKSVGNGIAQGGTIEKCINIGEVSSATNCDKNDKQMSAIDEGSNTTDMLGDELQSYLGTENWTFTDEMYPMIKTLNTSDYMIVAATPVILNSSETVRGVETAFTYGTGNSVNWVCNKPSVVSFINGTAYLSNPNEDPENVELTVSKGNASKKIAMAIKHVPGTTPTINWVSDLGKIVYGTPFTLSDEQKATISPTEALAEGRIEYSVTEGTTLNADSYNISATYIPNAGSPWLSTSTSAHLLVSKKEVPTIIWKPENNTYPYGDANNNSKIMCAVAKDGDIEINGTFTYEIPALNAGKQTVKIIGFESTNYKISDLTSTPIEKEITVAPTPVSISWSQPKAIAAGTAISNLQLGAFCAIGGTITYQKIYNEDTTSINIGDVLPVGKYKLRATFRPSAENSNYAEAFKEVDLAVKAVPTITWSKPDDIALGTAISAKQLNAVVSPADAGTIKYSIDQNGTPALNHVFESLGFHTLWATVEESENYMGAQKSVRIEVVEQPIEFTWYPENITYGASEDEIKDKIKNATAKQGATTLSGLEYNIPNPLNAGNQIVSVTVNDVTAQRTINVAQATPTITWEPQGYTFGASEEEYKSVIETATATFKGATLAGLFSYTYGQINTNNREQTITMTFTPDDAVNFKQVENKVKTITVAKATPSVTWNFPDEITITYGTALSKEILLNAQTTATGKVKFFMANGGNAMDTILNAGTHVVTAILEESGNYLEWTATKTVIVTKVAPVIEWTPENVAWGASDDVINSKIKKAVAKDAAGNVLSGEFKYTLPELNTIGSANVSVEFENDNYVTASAITKNISVTKASPVIAWTPQSVVYGSADSEIQSRIDKATASYNGEAVEGTFAYELPSPLNAGIQNITATFTPNDTEKFIVATGTAELTVDKATPVIEWTPKTEIAFGTALNNETLNATANVDGKFAYIPDADSVLKVGALTISTVFTPTDVNNYNSATAEVTINVVKANPVITWSTPSDINEGTALSDAQLNAAANVDGNFKYEPANGTVLSVGEHQKLTVTFTPTDANNYNNVSDSVFINVKELIDTTTVKPNVEIVWTPSSIVYGTPVGETFNAEANVEGVFSYSLAADSILGAGEYKVTATLSPVNGNDTTIERIVKVTKAELTATAANDTIVQGDTMPNFEINYKGFVGNDNVASLTTAPTATCSVSTDSVGSFEIVVSGGEAINYDFKHVNGLLTILAKGDTLPKPNDTTGVAIITWTPAVRIITYGTLIDSTILNATANVEGAFTYAARQEILTVYDTIPSEIVYEYITRSLAIGDTLNVGKYDLIATFTPADSTIKAVNDTITLIVNEVNGSIISWAPAVSTITYGTLIDSTILNATAKVEGTFTYLAVKIKINEKVFAPEDAPTEPVFDTVYTTRSLAIGDTLNAGTYELIATFIPDDSTMNAVNDTVMLTVGKAVLNVTVADVTINQGDNLPEFTLSCKGFVLGENESNLEYAPKAKCDASTDEAGTFDILVFSGLSDNYIFECHNGKLTVLKKADDPSAINETAAIFEVYPNPSNGAFFINAGDEAQEVRIFNSTGKLVKVENIEGVTRIDISEYANGMYFVKVGNQTKTVIKQ